MLRSGLALLAFGWGIGLPACSGDDGDTQNLPVQPQILPRTEEGIVGFKLTRQGENCAFDAVFTNGGQKELRLESVRLEGPGREAFVMGAPSATKISSRAAAVVPLSFQPPGRGVYLATLVVESNAANFSTYELELVGPGADAFIPDEPDIEVVETSVTVGTSPMASVPIAFVRFYNLGLRSLRVKQYELTDAAFQLWSGSADPSAVCVYGIPCGPTSTAADGCCTGGLPCICTAYDQSDTCTSHNCGDVIVTSGEFIAFGVVFANDAAAGAHTGDLRIHTGTNDPQILNNPSYTSRDRGEDADTPVATVSIQGTK